MSAKCGDVSVEIKSLIFWCLALFSLAILLASRYILGYWNDYMWLPLGVFLLSLLLATFFSKKGLKSFLLARTTASGMNFFTAVVICLGFLIGINYLTIKYNQVLDISADQRFSLSAASSNFLMQLEEDFEIIAFYTKEDAKRKNAAFQVLSKMQLASDKLKVAFFDPNLYPDEVKKYNIKTSGTFIIKGAGKQSRLIDSTNPRVAKEASGIKEENIINTLIQLNRKEDVLLCYTNGHNEKKLNDTSIMGASDFYASLNDLAYDFLFLDLKNEKLIPPGCNVLIVLGPEYAYNESALDLIYTYLNAGGNALIAMDPGKRHNLGRISKYVGLEFSNLYIVDSKGEIAGANAALALGYNYNQSHPVTANLNNTLNSFFPVASFFSEVKVEKWRTEALIYSSDRSFSQQSLTRSPEQDVTSDLVGPFPLAFFVESKIEPKSKIIMFADSDFVLNQFYLKVSNSDIALNAISYLSGETNHIGVNRKAQAQQVLILSNVHKNIFVVIFISIPIFFIILALYLHFRFKNE